MSHSLIILYHRIFHKGFSAFGNIISWEVGRVLALSGVPAAKDVGACCLLASIGCSCVFDVLYIGLQF